MQPTPFSNTKSNRRLADAYCSLVLLWVIGLMRVNMKWRAQFPDHPLECLFSYRLGGDREYPLWGIRRHSTRSRSFTNARPAREARAINSSTW
jgi:hypothetical protein